MAAAAIKTWALFLETKSYAPPLEPEGAPTFPVARFLLILLPTATPAGFKALFFRGVGGRGMGDAFALLLRRSVRPAALLLFEKSDFREEGGADRGALF